MTNVGEFRIKLNRGSSEIPVARTRGQRHTKRKANGCTECAGAPHFNCTALVWLSGFTVRWTPSLVCRPSLQLVAGGILRFGTEYRLLLVTAARWNILGAGGFPQSPSTVCLPPPPSSPDLASFALHPYSRGGERHGLVR
eukprot:1281671-Rhodomonas_salina.3